MRSWCALGIVFAVGCASDEEVQLERVELLAQRNERRIEQLRLGTDRIEALEALAELPPAPDEEARGRIEVLALEVTRLREQLDRTQRALEALRVEVASAERDRAQGGRLLTAIEDERGRPRGEVPIPDGPLQVLTVGSGNELLVQTRQGLVRFVLEGVEAPVSPLLYGEDPGLRRRHAQRFGEGAVESDAAAQASSRHLDALLRDREVRLDGPPAPGPAGSQVAYIEVDGEDVGAAMIRAGYAVAGLEDHVRLERYQTLETEARVAGRGLWGERPAGAE